MKKLLSLSSRAFIMVAGCLLLSTTRSWGQTNPIPVSGISSCVPAAVTGNFLYTFCPGGSLKIFDISNPTNAFDVGYTDAETCQALAIAGNYAYVVNNSALQVLNIENPTNPLIEGHVDGTWQNVAVAGNHAYLSGTRPGGSSICDVSTPANPVIVGGMPAANDVAVHDHYAYLLTSVPLESFCGVRVCDVNDAGHATIVSSASMTNMPLRLLAAGESLYATAYDKGGNYCWIFDLSNPANLVHLKTFAYVYMNMAVAGNYLYLPGSDYNFVVYNISNPTNTPLAGQASLPAYPGQRGLVISRNYAYVQTASYGIETYFLGTPAPPGLTVGPPTSNAIALSWPTPAAAFAVQQSAILSPPNWTTVTDKSVVVAGKNQVVLHAPNEPMFYRLISE